MASCFPECCLSESDRAPGKYANEAEDDDPVIRTPFQLFPETP